MVDGLLIVGLIVVAIAGFAFWLVHGAAVGKKADQRLRQFAESSGLQCKISEDRDRVDVCLGMYRGYALRVDPLGHTIHVGVNYDVPLEFSETERRVLIEEATEKVITGNSTFDDRFVHCRASPQVAKLMRDPTWHDSLTRLIVSHRRDLKYVYFMGVYDFEGDIGFRRTLASRFCKRGQSHKPRYIDLEFLEEVLPKLIAVAETIDGLGRSVGARKR